MKQNVAKYWNLVTALCVFVVIPTNAVLAWQEETGMFSTPIGRVLNMYLFFTILSNSLAGLVSAYLYVEPNKDSPGFNVARHTALVCITVTSVVYHLLLAGEEELTGLNVVTDLFLHTIIPLLYIGGWLIFGPRGRSTWAVAWKSLIFPICWAVFAMIRGPIVDYYPYPFMDVRDLGYAQTLTTMGFVTVFFVVLTVVYKYVDQLLRRSAT
jgi:hypothetical protein